MNTKNIYIGKIIRERLDASGMTYSEFAKRIHVSRTSLYSMFDSKSIDVERLIRISDVLECNFFYEVYGIGCKAGKEYPFLAIPFVNGKLDISNLRDEEIQELKTVIYKDNNDAK